MTRFWRASGLSYRLPGSLVGLENQDSREYMHRSVYQLTFPFTSELIPMPPYFPPALAPCWSLNGIIPRVSRTNLFNRAWAPRHTAAGRWWWRWPVWKGVTEGLEIEIEIPEARYSSLEASLTWLWIQRSLTLAEDEAREGDEDEGTGTGTGTGAQGQRIGISLLAFFQTILGADLDDS